VKLAHTAICVPDIDAAVEWYSSVLGLTVLSPAYRMEGPSITDDMGELLTGRPVAVCAAILGNEAGDHVLELIAYPNEPEADGQPRAMNQPGISHVGFVCDDIEATRARLEASGAEFIVEGAARIAGLRTTWCRDPWGTVLILLEKSDPAQPYWHQY
jgi:catechol 2,3-dioxygenase-like lactoylglutathione lyase family enzyme